MMKLSSLLQLVFSIFYCVQQCNSFTNHNFIAFRATTARNFPSKALFMQSSATDVTSIAREKYPELVKCITREYATFFNPLDRRFYADDVTFVDPLTSFTGIDNYKRNIDMLAGRSGIGKFMFEDASIALHTVEMIAGNKLQTRWTLQVTVKSLPWKPRARFTGISVYTLTSNLKQVQKQEDFWDSVNLVNGQYRVQSFQDGLKDFVGQVKKQESATMNAPELPYELLRRTKYYEVRRYPAYLAAETSYDKRPEGYDRLGSYMSGSNEGNKKLKYYSPTLMQINDETASRSKVMTWPLTYISPGKNDNGDNNSGYPEPTIPKVTLVQKPAQVVAVLRFEAAATEEVVRRCTKDLVTCVQNDGMVVAPEAQEGKKFTVGQFDALFSLNKRRIEVWVALADHPWMK